MTKLAQFQERITERLWLADLDTFPVWQAKGLQALRLIYVVARDLLDGQLTLRAMSLVYTTLLSIVPLLAVSFSVLKAFGVHNQIEPLVLRLLAPLGAKGVEISSRIIEFVENVKAGVLGAVGLAFLLYTVVSLLQKVERTFNYTWHVSHHRPFSQRFSDYLSVILIGPVLVFSALGLTASVMSNEIVQRLIAPFGGAVETASRLVPYLLIIAAFAFIYVFIPNTKVRARSALVGAVVAGFLWETAGWLFASFIVGSTKYTAIYSTFATLLVLMIWLYTSWLILLVGGSIAFYHQHPEFVTYRRPELSLSGRMKERLALLVMTLIGQSFHRRGPGWTAEALAQHLRVPMETMDHLLATLHQRELLEPTEGEPQVFLPGHSLESIEVREILDAVRTAGETPYLNTERLPFEPAVEQVLGSLDRAWEDALDHRTLRDLVAENRPVAAPSRQSQV
jgi:membrane protein